MIGPGGSVDGAAGPPSPENQAVYEIEPMPAVPITRELHPTSHDEADTPYIAREGPSARSLAPAHSDWASESVNGDRKPTNTGAGNVGSLALNPSTVRAENMPAAKHAPLPVPDQTPEDIGLISLREIMTRVKPADAPPAEQPAPAPDQSPATTPASTTAAASPAPPKSDPKDGPRQHEDAGNGHVAATVRPATEKPAGDVEQPPTAQPAPLTADNVEQPPADQPEASTNDQPEWGEGVETSNIPPDQASPEEVAVDGLVAATTAPTGHQDKPATAEGTGSQPPEEPRPTSGAPAQPRVELGESGRLIEASPTLKDMVEPLSTKGAETLADSLARLATEKGMDKDVWELQPHGKNGRGFLIEDAIAAMVKECHPDTVHLHARHPTVDLWDKERVWSMEDENKTRLWDSGRGVVTSIKSLNLEAETYQNMPKFEGKLREHLNHLLRYNPTTVNGERVFARQIRGREFILAIPRTGMTADHVARLEKVVTDSKYSGIMMKIVVIP